MKKIPTHPPHLFPGNDLPVNIPSEDVAWADMRKRLDEKERRRPFFWWWLIPGIFVLCGGAWMIINSKKINQPVIVVTDKAHSNKANNQLSDRTINSNIQQSHSITNNTDKTTYIESKSITPGTEIQNVKRATNQNATNASRFTVNEETRSELTGQPDVASGSLNEIAIPVTTSAVSNKTEASASMVDTIKTKDSIATATNEIEPGEKEDAKQASWQAGLQWNAQLHFSNFSNYFDGPDGKAQPWRLLLPSVWVQWQDEKLILALEANAFETSVLANKPYQQSTINTPAAVVSESKTINKLFGAGLRLTADYKIAGDLYAGGGITMSYWSNAAETVDSVYQPLNGVVTTTTHNNKLSGTDMKVFTRFQMGAAAELLYKQPKWQLGWRNDLYFAPLINQPGQKNIFRSELFVRLRLITSDHK